MGEPVAKKIIGQENWKQFGLPDIRDIDVGLQALPPLEMEGAPNMESALSQVALGFGLQEGVDAMLLETPCGTVAVQRKGLAHIVEKRPNSRERFTAFAVDTVKKPLEVWRTDYDDGSSRLIFIGVYQAKYQMLVIVHLEHGRVLWNFMNCDKKALNKHRNGELIYRSYQS
jgi:hypothetical protein